MSSLMDQRQVDGLLGIVQSRSQSYLDILRGIVFDGVPPGMEDLDTRQKRRVIERTVVRGATQEQRGTMPGNLNSTMLQHPAMQGMLTEEAADGPA